MTISINKFMKTLIVSIVLLTALLGTQSCRKSNDSEPVDTSISDDALLRSAKSWLKQQNELPTSMESDMGVDPKTLVPDWSKAEYSTNDDGEKIVAVPMGKFSGNYITLNVCLRNKEVLGMYQHYVNLDAEKALLRTYNGVGKLVAEGNFDKKTKVYTETFRAVLKSPLFKSKMEGGGEGGEGGGIEDNGTLEEVVIVGAPNPYIPIPDNGFVTYPGMPSFDVTTVNVTISAPTGGSSIESNGISDYLSVINCSNSATLTIYCDQPIANNPTAFTLPLGGQGPDVGHTFISIEQGNHTRVLGFYPASAVNPLSTSANKKFVNDSGHQYDVKFSKQILGAKVCKVLDYIKNNTPNYNLNSFNCTNFAVKVFSEAGIALPANSGNWPGGSGLNPGRLGQDLRSLSGHVSGTSSAPNNL